MNTGLLFFFILCFAVASRSELSMKYIQSVTIDTQFKFKGTKLGGFSGLVAKNEDLYVISDDRGRTGEPRMYKLKLISTSTKPGNIRFQLSVVDKISILKKAKKLPVYDFEALSPMNDGWWVSSEGDLNIKPRLSPEVFYVQNESIQQKLEFPADFRPKFNGQQTRGLYNNKAFEGMYFDQSEERLFLVSESGLVQKKEDDLVFYILEYLQKKGKFKFDKVSRLDFTDKIEGSFLYHGASDFTKVSDNKYLLLTRSVQTALSLQYTNIVWLVKRKSVDDPWEFHEQYRLNQNGDNEDLNQNYEGMSIIEINGIKYLVMVSDDNFKSFEKTVFSFFELEVK